jgi:hypothetical protein
MSKRPRLPLSSTGENNFYYLYTDYQGNLQIVAGAAAAAIGAGVGTAIGGESFFAGMVAE